jgi:predicted aconitase
MTDIRDPNNKPDEFQETLNPANFDEIAKKVQEAQEFIMVNQPLVAKYYQHVKFCNSLKVNPYTLANKHKQ